MTENPTMPTDDDEATDAELRSVAGGCMWAVGLFIGTIVFIFLLIY